MASPWTASGFKRVCGAAPPGRGRPPGRPLSSASPEPRKPARGPAAAQGGRPTKLLNLLALLLLITGSSVAQDNSILRGTVEDPSGQPIPGASVRLTNKNTQEQRKATSDDNGYFEFRELPSGDYLIRARASGFEETVAPVHAGPTPKPPIHLRLAISALTEEVTVNEKAPSVPSPAQNPDTVYLREHLLERLPIKESDLLSLSSIFLDPAATGVEGPQIVVDGMEGETLDMPASAVKRIYVNKNPYSAEFGRPGRGRVEVTTENGSRHHFHRNISFLFRNSALDARNAFAKERPDTQRALFEGEFDGPLAGERATFFVGGRYFRYSDSAVVTAQTPAGRLVENVDTPERGGRLFTRLDFRLTPTHSLKALYRLKDDTKDNRNVGGFNLRERATDAFAREHRLTLSETGILSPASSNEARLSIKHERDDVRSRTTAPALVVLDAFSAGGAQASQQQREDAVEVQDVVNYIRSNHTIRFGGDLRFRFLRTSDAANFGGTFLFSSLSDFTAGRPFLFTVNQGNPRIGFTQHEFYYFVQDEVRLRRDLSASLGLRHEFQTAPSDHNNLAPRLALAYAPGGGRTVLRAGSGIFYEHQPKALQERSLLLDGRRTRQAVVADPIFSPTLPVPESPNVVTPSVSRAAPDLRTPYLVESSLGVERRLGAGRNFVSAEYTRRRGVKLYRTRNINAPRPETGLRADPDFININQFESSGTSRSNGLRLTFQIGRNWFEILSQYTLSRSKDDTSGLFAWPADNFDLRGEWGRSDFDRLHRLNLFGTLKLPRRFMLGAMAQFSSGPPFNVTTGFDDNHDTVANDRPPGVARNTGQGPGFANIDVRLSKRFALRRSERLPYLEFYADAFNLLNHVNFKNFAGTLSSPFFGRANAAFPARQLQMTLRARF